MKKQERIVLLAIKFPTQSETFLVSKFLGLLDFDWNVHLVCAKSDGAQWGNYPALDRQSFKQRVHVDWTHRPRWLAVFLSPLRTLQTFLFNPFGAWKYLIKAVRWFGVADAWRRFYLDSTVIALRPDIVHFEFGSLAVEQADLGELLGCKLVVSFRGYDLNFAGLDQPDYYAKVWKYSDALHLLGQDLWKRAQARGCPSDKPHVLVPPALELEKFIPKERDFSEPLGTPESPLRILSVGRLEWKKGYEYALQSVRMLLDAGINCRLRIVGAGKFYEALAFARHQLGLKEHVEFLGGLPHPRVIEEMHDTDIFLHPSLSEGFCNAVLEAQAMQIPVVCTDAGSLPENIIDGQTGFVVPRRDPAAMADKMILLARDPSLRQAFGKAGRERVKQNFTLAQQLEKFGDFYRGVLAE
jgi:colanic acid/amylovoran biosynthesis glycosyltransferase